MGEIIIVCNSRAERGPLQSVIAALPEARVVSFDVAGFTPHMAMAHALGYFYTAFQDARIVIVLGDRYETLAAAQAAMFRRIPVAHIHGGETTTGAFDDALRAGITAIASLHFPATFKAHGRIRELRHDIENYSMTMAGAPGLDGIERGSARRDKPVFLVTYHPETRAVDYGLAGCEAMLTALAEYAPTHEIMFCGVNEDPGAMKIRDAINRYCRKYGGSVMHNMSHDSYIGVMQRAQLVVGNSSAGVIEAPWVGCPSVNVGRRQEGREMANSIFQFDSHAWVLDEAMNFTGDPRPIYQGGAAPWIAQAVRDFIK